jgi:Na+-transporting NADH:ubiquinone oxidoreductase subunit C
MDKNSGGFTFLFASVMVIVVAVLLSLAAMGLKSYQEQNVRAEKMQNILQSIGVQSDRDGAEKIFNQFIRERLTLNNQGDVVKGGIDPFDIDLKKEQDKLKTGDGDKQLFPLFVLSKENETYYVIPARGKGLWGPIWGYIALKGDMNTISGVSLDHKSETPGLGAEISTPVFQKQFVGKKIFDDSGEFTSVRVIKGGAAPSDLHGVDAISGGTVTSNGVTEMLKRTLGNYLPYMKSKEKQALR